MCHRAQPIKKKYFVETDSHYIAQADLASSDLPALASQSAGITGISHEISIHSLTFLFLIEIVLTILVPLPLFFFI